MQRFIEKVVLSEIERCSHHGVLLLPEARPDRFVVLQSTKRDLAMSVECADLIGLGSSYSQRMLGKYSKDRKAQGKSDRHARELSGFSSLTALSFSIEGRYTS